MVEAATILRARQNPDGGFGPIAGAGSETESTAIATLALSNDDAAEWLAARQDGNGGFVDVVGDVASDRTAIAALALPAGSARERALNHLESIYASGGTDNDVVPHDTSVRGWPWTQDALGWTEPTAWGLLALRRHRPSATDRIDDAVELLRDRECVGGGWNYGNRVAFGVELPPYVQTTAVAVVALRGVEGDPGAAGLRWLRRSWRSESQGLLSVSTSCAAFGLHGDPSYEETRAGLVALLDETAEPDTMALAWATIALDEEWEGLSP